MKRLLSILTLLALAGSAFVSPAVGQSGVIVLSQRPMADLVRTLGGEMGHNPSVNNAEIISDALASRQYDIVNIPAGICETTETIVFPNACGCTLQGAAAGADLGDNAYQSTGQGGTATRIVANFDTTEQPIIEYRGKHGKIQDLSLEGYRIPGNTWNTLVSASNANPIVCTTSSAHGLSDNDRIQIHGIRATSNTLANGNFYVDVLSSTTFALYSASGPTTAVSGAAGGTSAFADTVVWRKYNRAQIGIHVVTQATSGFATGKALFRNISFVDLPVGILWGTGMHQAWAEAADYIGETDANADVSVVENCFWYYPVTNNDPDHRTCSYHRTIQSIGFDFTHCTLNGWAHECSYFERGGSADMKWFVNGNATVGVLRLGVPNYQVNFDLWVDVDGGSSAYIGRETTILQMDDQASSGAQIRIGGNHRAAWNYTVMPIQQPMFVVRGPCSLKLEDFNGLTEDCIQAIGSGSGATSKLALVSFHSCTTYGRTDMSTLFRATDEATFASAVPLVGRWYDCKAAFYNSGGVTPLKAITDGSFLTNDGDTTFGP